ncbi:hypothetical protein CERZMDRAFT_93296 [Cercospora zeae-maydis SCOH1-5]|uniref:Uncharacterized protein n=1 Tax=Cercospora zeae-maydis SCOH1-5 TaxID=717836 RepID=A0A6A6FUU1_9PEZI|nr:hypothetical protein CERZMDRAFT_93296 [Cercospora zeae-maydis SCOH1-5]
MKLTTVATVAFCAATATCTTQTLSSNLSLLIPEPMAASGATEVKILRVRPGEEEEEEEEQEASPDFPVANETLSTRPTTTRANLITRQAPNQKAPNPSVFHCETIGNNRYHCPSSPSMKRETQPNRISTSTTPITTARVHLKDLARPCAKGMVKACDWQYPASVITTSYKTCYCAPKDMVPATGV